MNLLLIVSCFLVMWLILKTFLLTKKASCLLDDCATEKVSEFLKNNNACVSTAKNVLKDDVVNVDFKTGTIKAPIESVSITYIEMTKIAAYGSFNEDLGGYKVEQILNFISRLIKKYEAGEVVEISEDLQNRILKINEYEKLYYSAISCIPDEIVRKNLMNKWKDVLND